MNWMHSLRNLAVGALILAASSLSTTAFGAAYLKFDGVDGESKAPGRTGWIDLMSCSHDITNMRSGRAGGGGGGAGKASFSDLSFAKQYDKSSPKLAEACASGRRFASIDIEFTELRGEVAEPYLKIKLSDCIISSYQMSSGGDRPTESLSLNFTKITWDYFFDDDTGQPATVHGGWDLATNKKI